MFDYPNFKKSAQGVLIEKFDGKGEIAILINPNENDFYPTYFFIQRILGKPDGKWAIDVYKAVNMGICGILAWRSALNGNIPIDVPDLSKPEEREKFRNDNACTNPEVAGEQLVPQTTSDMQEIPDKVYENVKKLWESGLDLNGEVDMVYSSL